MRGCSSGKISYASPQEAWRASDIIKRRSKKAMVRGSRKRGSSAYKCPECQQWHTTSSPQ